MLFYCMDLRFYKKILQKYDFFFKKIEIFEIQNFKKILFYGLKILSKNFGKSWNIFLKNIDV